MPGKVFSLYLLTIYWISISDFSKCAALQNNARIESNWYGHGCPPHATGQFPFEDDCRKFYNCFKGRGQLSICAPGTLFNPTILECDFPEKVTCMKTGEKSRYISRITETINPGQPSHQHHHHHHHSPEYHGKGHHHSQGPVPDYDHHTRHYHSWDQSSSQIQPNAPRPLQRGHYIYNTKTLPSVGTVPAGPYHSGVQPPGMLPSMPSRDLLPPPYPSEPQQLVPSTPILVQTIPSQSSNGYYPSPNPNPFVPRQVFITNPQVVPEKNDFDKKFQTVIPQPTVVYNSYGVPITNTGNPVKFPESGQAHTVNVQYPQPVPTNYYPNVHSVYVPPSVPNPNVFNNQNPYQEGYGHPGDFQSGHRANPTSNGQVPDAGNTNPIYTKVSQPEENLKPKNDEKDKCPKDYQGLMAHSDCSKFLSCANGRTFVMDCGPGTRFHPELFNCVHAHEVKCNKDDAVEDITDLDTEGTRNRESALTPDLPEQSPEKCTTTEEPLTEQVTENSDGNQQFEDNQNSEEVVYETPLPRSPTYSIKQSISVHTDDSSSNSKNIFRPTNTTSSTANLNLPQGKFISKRNSTVDRQILRLRGSPSQFEGFVEMQLSPGSWGIMCDKPSKWKSEEAHIICKTLGYPRGAELTWQGLPAEVNNTISQVLASDEVICTGDEESILECTISVGSGCQPANHGIWVRCYGHGQSRCHPGEMSLGEKCYSLVIPNEETSSEHLVGFTQGEALAHCQKNGGHLLDITSQLENDFVSEWLLRQNVSENIMTSGVGMPLMGGTIWIWEGSESTFTYHNWWPGWTGVKSIPPPTNSRAHCIVMKRHFPCQESNGGEDKLCDAQYYFWDLEDCDAMSTSLPYVCERPANKIGCIMGTGTSYKGGANVTKTGKTCLDWETKEVLAELKYKISESDRKMSLTGHNYCRNVAGKESHPWCFVKEGKLIKKDLCDIPECSRAIEKSARYFQCPSDHFSCGSNGECIASNKVCDGHFDCSNSLDEVGCTKSQNKEKPAELSILSDFKIYEHMKLIIMEIEIFVSTPLSDCAQKCLERVNCRSFSYYPAQEQCLLSESNIGLSGGLIHADEWNYYELLSKSLNCQNSHICDNGKCIANETVCNGRNDCGDNSDEKDCSWLKQKIQIRLSGGSKPNEGTIEVKAMDRWGLICDDEFDMKDGDVVCRHLGFPLGALEIKKHTFFKPNHTSSFLIDNLSCKGNESSVADCHHNGWGIHDCREEEYNSIDFMKCSNKAAGVICRVTKTDCKFNYWQCEGSAECIPLGFLCDNVKDCADNSDEDPVKCNAPVEVRLVGIGGESRSNKVTEGRVEVRRFGVWGTVCDDDFGVKEAEVVCKSLGFKGNAQAYKEAAYGAGQGIIWLDQVHCLGNETNITQCMSDAWGQTNCRHNEDVAVACSPQMLNVPSKAIGKKEQEIVDQNVDINIDDIFLQNCGTIMDNLDLISSDFAPRVVSGFETVKGTYPWQATIRVKSVSGKSSHWCGAVVVSRFHVITAGHCLRDYIKAAYFVRAGDYDNEKEEGTEQDLEIDELWIHPDLDNGVRLNNDIAVVKVKNPGFEFNTWVLPACLPKGKEPIPHNCTISGWGSNSNPGMGFARILHATWLQPVPSQKCKSAAIYGNSLSEGMFCAGSLDGGPDSCQGDSGGPFLCPVEGQLTLFGITSWGHGCGRTNSPGVYTSVPYYLDWIQNKIKFSMINTARKSRKIS